MGSQARTKTILVHCHLHAFDVSFEDKKWGFVYSGAKVYMAIEDQDFWSQINSNLAISKGTILEVDVEITQEFDKSVNDYLNKTFRVTKVHEVIEPSKQMDIFE